MHAQQRAAQEIRSSWQYAFQSTHMNATLPLRRMCFDWRDARYNLLFPQRCVMARPLRQLRSAAADCANASQPAAAGTLTSGRGGENSDAAAGIGGGDDAISRCTGLSQLVCEDIAGPPRERPTPGHAQRTISNR